MFNKQLAVADSNPDGSYTCVAGLPIDKSYKLTGPKDLPRADPSFTSLCADDGTFIPALALMNSSVIKIMCEELRRSNPDLADTHTFAIAVDGNNVTLLVREKQETTAGGGGGQNPTVKSDVAFRKKHPFPTEEEIKTAKNDPTIVPHKGGLSRSKVYTIAGSTSQCIRYFASNGLKIVKTSDQPKDARLVRIRVFFEDRPKAATDANTNVDT